MHKILECVPNISEGRDKQIIDDIVNVITGHAGVKLLDIDTGYSANRTVITFAGEPDNVVEAAFQMIKKSTALIDMKNHRGAHPRFGAVDVCPLIPVKNVNMDEAVGHARNLAQRTGNELGIPTYCYEHAAFTSRRKNLAHVRRLEYEGLIHQYHHHNWQPDFGPVDFNLETGAMAVGARKILIAYNVNLLSRDVNIAKSIARQVRESGYYSNTNGKRKKIPGLLKAVKAIGWYMDQYDRAQVSMNLTDAEITPVHIAFEKVRELAGKMSTRVTGSELVGLIPLETLLEAGLYFKEKMNEAQGGKAKQELEQEQKQEQEHEQEKNQKQKHEYEQKQELEQVEKQEQKQEQVKKQKQEHEYENLQSIHDKQNIEYQSWVEEESGNREVHSQNRKNQIRVESKYYQELLNIAINQLGLNEVKPFEPERKIIEYALENPLLYNE